MNDEFETIATFANPVEAQLAQNRLRSAGIQAVLANETAVDGITLLVPADDAPEARICLADFSFDDRARSEQITTTPQAVTEPLQPADDADDEPTVREENARRAFSAAVLGLLCLPIQFYVIYLLLVILNSNEVLRPQYQRKAWLAAVMNIPLIALLLFFVARLLQVLALR